jgi:hypothetical protein
MTSSLVSDAVVRAAGVADRSRLYWKLVNRLAALGERRGADWLVYNPLLFAYYHRMAVLAGPAAMATIAETFPSAQRYVDVGAGAGGFAAAATARGMDVLALERSRQGRWLARRQGVTTRAFDLREPPPAGLGAPFDLAYCFEVAEHLEAPLGERLASLLAQLAPVLVFTAAQPGQGGIGHVNSQPKAYWVERFERHGLAHREVLSARVATGFARSGPATHWLADNVMVFTRSDRE